LVCLFLALFWWLWTSGFVLGSLSGRATRLTGTLFCLVVHSWYSLRLILPRGLTLPRAQLWETVLNLFFMMTVPMLPFLAAAIWGMNRGVRLRALGFRQALLLAASFAALTSLVSWTSGWCMRESVRFGARANGTLFLGQPGCCRSQSSDGPLHICWQPQACAVGERTKEKKNEQNVDYASDAS
jgi:hypothetical protein